MGHPEGARETCGGRLGFDRRVRLEFCGSKIISDVGWLLFRELDEVLGLHDIAGGLLRDPRTGHNRLHTLVGLLGQSVFGSLARYVQHELKRFFREDFAVAIPKQNAP